MTVNGRARVWGAIGTLSYTGIDSKADWQITSLHIESEAQFSEGAAQGLVLQKAVFNRKRTAQVVVVAQAKSGGDNTKANALAAVTLPNEMDVVTVAGSDLPVLAPGTWNCTKAGMPMADGEWVRVELTLERVWDGSAYVALTAVA